MNYLFLFLVPVFGAAAGWLIISAAVLLLFRPACPVTIPLLGIRLHGILPKKRSELAAGIGEIIQTQLEMAVTGHNPAADSFRSRMKDSVVSSVREHLEIRLPFLLPQRIKNAIISSVLDVVGKEFSRYFEAFAGNIMSPGGVGGHLEIMVLDKINSLDLEDLYSRVNHSREILMLKAAAALIGFAAGLLQLLLVWAAVA